MVTTLLDEIEAFLRAASLPPTRASIKVSSRFDTEPPWYECPDCKVLWQPPLNRGCRRVRGRVHQCWSTTLCR
jgi:hypothetical protein